MAYRLENMEAVQQMSQWRVEFEPRNQILTLHWIKTRRGTAEFGHTNLNKLHLLQREAGLEGCVIDGLFTALLLLEDVRPGDVLEWCYTCEARPRFLPENHFALFRLPGAVPVGRVFFATRFAVVRPMKWKSSSAELALEENRGENEVIWKWSRENYMSAEPEANVPAWHPTHPWIQISDCQDWGIVSRAIVSAWDQSVVEESAIASLVEEVCGQETELLARIQRALRLVQDEFRYLSVNLEHGGQIPTPPGTVARRRFGDCKDLSVLLVHVFRRLGVESSPVLVNTVLRRSIGQMLPTPNLFDHVVLQFTVQGETRWVDVTLKDQGGDPLNRVLPNFGVGLVLTATTVQLVKPPARSVEHGTLRVRENILLDTTGANSSLAIVETGEGSQAEMMRHQFATVPLEEVARQRLQHCANRFGNARRLSDLQFRDDREANEFHVAEVFEVNGFLTPNDQPGFCDFLLPPNPINSSLQLPQTLTRRDPFALPQPCNLIYTIEVQIGADQPHGRPRTRVTSPLLDFTRQFRCLPGSWSITLTLSILDDVVMTEQFKEHAQKVQEIWRESTWRLMTPLGQPARGRNRSFGALPSPRRPVSASNASAARGVPKPASATPPVKPGAPQPSATTVAPEMEPWRIAAAGEFRETSGRRRRSARSKTPNKRRGRPVVLVLVIAIIVLLLILLFATIAAPAS